VNYAAEIKLKLQFETQNIPKYFADNFYTFEKDIRELIKKRWKTGKKPNGGIIGIYRSIDYALFKKQKSDAPFRVVDLTLTGRLGDGIQVELFNAQKGIFALATFAIWAIPKAPTIAPSHNLPPLAITAKIA